MLSRARSAVQRLIRHRSTRVTADGVRFLLLTLAVGVAAINTGNNLFYLLLAMMLSLILMSGIMADLCLRRLEFHRHVPDLLFVGEPATATVAVINRKPHLPSFSLRSEAIPKPVNSTMALKRKPPRKPAPVAPRRIAHAW